MKTIVLAAGYGTRLQPAIGDFPKSLVEVGGDTILDYVLQSVSEFQAPEDIAIVSNARYFNHFVDWLQSSDKQYQLLNDGSTDAESRLGAIGDIAFAIDQLEIDDDLLIVASDNIIQFSLEGLASACVERGKPHVGIYHNPDLQDQKRRGVLNVDAAGRVTTFEEKPQNPQSTWAASPLYALPRESVGFVRFHLEHGGNPDAPGYLMESLSRTRELRVWELPGEIVDIGTPESLAAAREKFGTSAS